MSLSRSLGLLLLCFLTGCALQRPGTPAPWNERRARLLEMRDWEARGRIAIRATPPAGGAGGPAAGQTAGQTGSQTGGQGNLQWIQAGDSARIRVSGPFGTGAYELDWHPGRLVVTGGKGTETLDYTGPDAAEQFVRGALGFSFPVASTRYWILGLPDPATTGQESYDEEGRLAAISQSGWEVRYEDYKLRGDLWMPHRIVMASDLGRLRLVIDDWQL